MFFLWRNLRDRSNSKPWNCEIGDREIEMQIHLKSCLMRSAFCVWNCWDRATLKSWNCETGAREMEMLIHGATILRRFSWSVNRTPLITGDFIRSVAYFCFSLPPPLFFGGSTFWGVTMLPFFHGYGNPNEMVTLWNSFWQWTMMLLLYFYIHRGDHWTMNVWHDSYF